MKFFKELLFVSLVIGIAMTSCEKDDETEPENNEPTENSLSCKVNGTEWTASLAVVAVNENGIVSITGSDSNAKQLNFSLNDVDGAGSYELGATLVNPNLGRWTEGVGQDDTYTTAIGIGAGTVEITEITETGFKGSFFFTAKNGSGVEVAITDGVFSAQFETE